MSHYNDEDGVLTFVCDECGCDDFVEDAFGDSAFRDTWEVLKADGWRCFKRDGKWFHSCPTCVKEWAMNKIAERRRGEADAQREAIANLYERNRR